MGPPCPTLLSGGGGVGRVSSRPLWCGGGEVHWVPSPLTLCSESVGEGVIGSPASSPCGVGVVGFIRASPLLLWRGGCEVPWVLPPCLCDVQVVWWGQFSFRRVVWRWRDHRDSPLHLPVVTRWWGSFGSPSSHLRCGGGGVHWVLPSLLLLCEGGGTHRVSPTVVWRWPGSLGLPFSLPLCCESVRACVGEGNIGSPLPLVVWRWWGSLHSKPHKHSPRRPTRPRHTIHQRVRWSACVGGWSSGMDLSNGSAGGGVLGSIVSGWGG